jgi:hypothetical protein
MKKNKRNLFPLFLSLSILLIIVSIALYQTVKIYKRSLAAPIVLVVQPTPTSKSPQIITPTGILTPTVTLEPKTCGLCASILTIRLSA